MLKVHEKIIKEAKNKYDTNNIVIQWFLKRFALNAERIKIIHLASFIIGVITLVIYAFSK